MIISVIEGTIFCRNQSNQPTNCANSDMLSGVKFISRDKIEQVSTFSFFFSFVRVCVFGIRRSRIVLIWCVCARVRANEMIRMIIERERIRERIRRRKRGRVTPARMMMKS